MTAEVVNTANLDYCPLCPECAAGLQMIWGAYITGRSYHFEAECGCMRCGFSASMDVDQEVSGQTEAQQKLMETWDEWTKLREGREQ